MQVFTKIWYKVEKRKKEKRRIYIEINKKKSIHSIRRLMKYA